ncbi:putative magnesium transporter NIPA7 [Paramyrothecium foliicola]|nr:putative magnesium transporter NIPA7 [Paramyrothecium foliicola]
MTTIKMPILTAGLWPATTPAAPSWPVTATEAPGSGEGPDDGNSPGETLRKWSSLIGIITAIVGNILIALALNVQRYAHIRLRRERTRIRRRARLALKRAQNDDQAGSYGSIGRNGSGGSNGHGSGDNLAETDTGYNETDPLTGSYHSDGNSGSRSAGEGSDEEDENDSKAASTYLKSPYWWLGQVLITLGETGNFLAYGFAPASIVSPLGVVALISNCIIAPAMFHEPFRPRDFWGVVIAVGGVVTVVLSARQEESKLNPHDVWDAITTLEFEIYMAVTVVLIGILMWASTKYGRRTILIDLGLVGLFGGYTALATKGVSSMLSSTLWRAFTTPVTYALIVILLATAIMQIRYVNKALQRFDSTQVIPIQFVMFTLCVIIGSAVLYRDFEKTTAEQAGKFVGGCLLTFFGVFLITSGRQSKDDDEDVLSEAEGIEETIGLGPHDGTSNHPATNFSTPKSQSRRSSKASRVNFSEVSKSHPTHNGLDVASLRHPIASNSQPALGRESVPLLNSLPQSSWDRPMTPPAGIRTLSTDSVAVTSASASIRAQSHPATPMGELQVPPLYPTDGLTTPRQGPNATKSHRGGTFISPSPLSSTVTTVVKDAFLRAKETPHDGMSSLRRIRSSIRASLFFNDDDSISDHQHVPAAADDSLIRRSETEPTGSDEDPARRRSRSLSDTLGDLFRPATYRRYSMFSGSGDHVGDSASRAPGESGHPANGQGS